MGGSGVWWRLSWGGWIDSPVTEIVDVETVKLAAEFVGQYDGSIEDAVAAISTVGGFVEQCGGAAKAKAALEVYESVAAAVGK